VAARWLLPALGANFFYTKTDKKQNQYSVQASASHNYRFPTLNDRFWPIGGNPDLLPEYSLSTDLKFKLISAGNGLQYRLEIGGYSNYVRNWIQWSPASGSGLWEPQNIARVWALGPELSALLDYRVAAHSFSLRGQYQLNRARRIGEADLSLQNKQLIYTPEHCAAASFDWTFRQTFSLRYRHNCFSTRFLDNANSQALPADQLGWLQMEYILNFKGLRLRLHATIDNLWAADYQAVANRPMPRRGLSVGLMIGF
jgi:iron complex outermembrane receptor protein